MDNFLVFSCLISVSLIMSIILYNKKKDNLNTKRLKFKWLTLYTLIPLFVYYFNELILVREQQIFVVLIKTPSILLFYFCIIIVFSFDRNKGFLMNVVKTILKIPTLLIPFVFYVTTMTFLSLMPQVAFIENPTSEEREIIEERYSIKLPEQIEGDLALYGMSFLQGSEYYLKFEMKEENWNEYKNKNQGNFKVSDSKRTGNVIVKIRGDERSTEGYSKLFYENASLWNYVIYLFRYQ